MASSVEMPSAPFGCVLRDHNRRDRCRETNARATMGAFQKNLKSLVRDHLCIAVSPKSGSNDSNSENQNVNNDDSWVRNDKEASSCSKKDENGNEREDGMTPRHARVLDRWAFARQMVSKPVERRRSAEADVFANNDENSNRNREREDESGSVMSPRHVRVLDRWAFARQMVAKPIERQRSAEAEVYSVPNSAPSSTRTSTSKEETIARTDSLVDLTKKGVGASSLVQIWEKRLHKSDTLKTNSNGNEISETSRSSSGVSSTENDNESNASPPRVSGAEKAESPVQKTEDSVEKAGDLVFSIEAGDSDFHMEKATESIDESYDPRDSFEDSDGIAVVDSQNLDAKEKEKGRVVDIIRRLTAQGPSSSLSTEDTSNDHDQQYGSTQSSPCRELLRERSGVDQAENKGLSEHKGLSHVLNSSHATSSPRLRGRQAFADLLMQFERDRHKELDTLVNQKTVSTFPQRGRTRIQSLLRLRLLKRGMAFVGSDAPPLPPKPSRVNKPAQGSSIMHLREKFCTGVEQGTIVQDDAPNSNSLQKDITKNTSVNVDKSSTCNKPSESTPNREVKGMEKQKKSTVLRASADVCEEVTPSSDKSCTSNKPGESTPSREVNVKEQRKTSTVLPASEDVCEKPTASLDKICTSNKPSESTPIREVKVIEQQKTATVLPASKDVCKDGTPILEKSCTSNKPCESTPSREVMEQQKTLTVLRARKDVREEAIPSLDKSCTSNKTCDSTPSREVKVMEQQKTSTVLRARKDVCEEATPSLDKSCTSIKPSESTPNREVKVMEKQKTSAVLLASKDVCDKANPSLDRSSTSIEPVESTTNREVKVMEQQKTSTVLRASENVCEEATSSLDKSMKSSTSSKPSECTLNREGKVMEQLKASLVLRASENVCEERTPSSDKSSSNKPSERVNVMEQQKTSPVLRASENVCKEPSPRLEVTFRETSAAAQSTLPNVSEDLRQETSLVAKKLDVQETANPTTTMSDPNVDEIWPNVDEIWKPKCSEARILDSQERADTRTALSGGAENGNEICEGTSSEARNLDAQEIADTTSSLNSWNDTRLEAGNFDSQENFDTTTSMVDWDENDDDYQYYGETNYDWISEISRPRSYWEDIRKSWYQEMLNSSSEKGEIHQLLERRTVSSFLTSDFRDKIDRLMVSRVERQTCHRISQEEEEEEDDESSYDRMNQMVSFLQQRTSASGAKEEAEEVQEHVQVQEQNQVQEQVTENVQVQEQNQVQEQVKEHVQVQEQNQVQEQVLDYVQVHKQVPKHQDQEDLEMTEEEEEEENDDNDDDDEESRSLISGQFLEASDYFDRASLQPSPSHFTTWSYQDNEVGDDSDGATSASPRQQSPFRYSPQRSPPQSYNASHQQGSPSLSHPLMEMELMYNMKGHMIQLYQEMSELRKAIKSCVDMQMTMQESMKQDAQSVQVGKKRNSNGFTKKGNCRICNEAKIDSLLYRCGHMCTCLKCAHDLQWNSGKCPICQAPIADVVRAYMDS